ncbi:MAG: DUF1501 domain-containing protein [Planctomycetota bacterium]
MQTFHNLSRRRFLRLGAGTAAMAGLSSVGLVGARPLGSGGFGDYKALVCVFLYGGADTFNLLVPTGAAGYATYAASRGDLAEPLASLLPIDPLGPIVGGGTYGLHGQVPELRDLFQAGRLAFVANVGPLVQPSPKAGLLNGTVPAPLSLFSHNDQQAQWQRAWADVAGSTGWAGRMLDALGDVNGATPLSPGISVDQQNRLMVGEKAAPYVIGSEGTVPLLASDDEEQRELYTELFATAKHKLGAPIGKTQIEAMEIEQLLSSKLAEGPTFEGLFPQGPLAEQLRMVARLIAIRAQLGVTRQVFFVSMGGYDTHGDQLTELPPLYRSLSETLGAFQQSLDQIGAASSVTTFSHTEFGRTLSSNGQGSDHGWGGHAFVLGDAVQGKRIFGAMPDLTLEGTDDLGEGRIIPTVAVDQFAATLGQWFGLSPSQALAVFPNLANFAELNLGFLG